MKQALTALFSFLCAAGVAMCGSQIFMEGPGSSLSAQIPREGEKWRREVEREMDS